MFFNINKILNKEIKICNGVYMNKKLIFTLGTFLLTVCLAVSSIFAEGYGVSGCGLGSVLIPTRDSFSQLVSYTINIFYFNQSVAITSGTSNCNSNSGAFNDREQELFAAVNMMSLEQEMAAGKGENLTAFASLLGCPNDQIITFGNMTRKEYQTFSNFSDTPSTFVKMVKANIAKDKTLSAACSI